MLLGYFRIHKVKNYEYKYDKNYKLNISVFNSLQSGMNDFISRSIRGGISLITHRYAKANNKYIPNSYNTNIPDSFIAYFDANNLYGWAMIQYLPICNYKWNVDINIDQILATEDNSDIGYICSVDLKIPNELHDKFKDYTPACENVCSADRPEFEDSQFMQNIAKELNVKKGKVKKLIPNLFNKDNYVIHYRHLKLLVELGIEVIELHNVLEFRQEPFLADFIMFNTQKRAESKLTYEKDLFKLLNNSIYGKTVENVEKRIDIKMVTNENDFIKKVSKPNYKCFKLFNNKLAAIEMNKKQIKYDKPIAVGFSVLELSKYKMYDFHYNVMKKLYPENGQLQLLFTDTDSLCYKIETKDLYEDMKNNKQYFDCSEYPETHPNYSVENKKIVGVFKEEQKGNPIEEMVLIRSKVYKYKVHKLFDNIEDKDLNKTTLKGISKTAAKKITLQDYKNCLLIDNEDRSKMETEVSFSMIKSDYHLLKTITVNKKALSAYDDKRYYLNMIDSLLFGHKDTQETLKKNLDIKYLKNIIN